MWPFRNECSCFDGKQRLLLDLSINRRATSQKGYILQNLDLLTALLSLLVISLLVIDLRRSHLFGFFLWNVDCIYRKILVTFTTCPILLLFSTSISPSSIFTFVVLLFLFLIMPLTIRLMPAQSILLRLHLALLLMMLLTRSFMSLLVVILLRVLRILSFSDEIRLLILRIRLDRL